MSDRGKVSVCHGDGRRSVTINVAIAGMFAALVLSLPAASSQADTWEGANLVPRQVIAGVLGSWPPQYSLDENGQPIGFAIDVMEEVAARAGIEVTYRVFDTFPNLVRALEEGRVDLIPNSGITPERAVKSAFTRPVETFVISIFVREGMPDIGGMADLAGRRVGVVERNVGVRLLKGRTDIQMVIFPSVHKAMLELLAGRVDALIYPQPVLRRLAQEVGIEDRIQVVGNPLLELKRAIRVPKHETELLAALNTAVEGFVGTPAYQRIYLKWYGMPKPFWSLARIGWTLGGVLMFVLVGMAGWRHHSMGVVNRRLRASVIERKKAEDQLKAHARQQAAISRFGRIALAGATTAELMDDAVALVADMLDVEYAKVLELLPGGDSLILRAGVGWKEGYVGAAKVDAGRGSQAGFTLLSAAPVVVEDFDAETRFAVPPLHREHDVVSGISVTIAGHDGPFGVLGANSAKRRAFVEDEINALQAIANVLAAAIHREHANEALRDSEGRFRQVAENIREVLWMSDPDKHEIIYVNPAYEEVWGRTRESLYENPRSFLDAIDPNDRERVTAAVAKQARGEYDEVYRIVRPDGSRRWIRDHAFPVRDESGRVYRIVGIASDITEPKRAEEALRESEERLKDFADAASDWFWEMGPDLRFTFHSDRYFEITGFRPEDKIDTTRTRYVDPSNLETDTAKWDAHFADLAAHRPFKNFEYGFTVHDGSSRHARISGVPVFDTEGKFHGYRGTGADITEHKRVEEALRESEQRLRSIAANVPGAIFRRVQKADGTVHYPFVSTAYGELFGHDPEGIMADASRLSEVVHPEDFERFQVAIERSVESLESQEVEYRIITPEGQTKWARSVAQPRRLENGDIVADGIVLDITDRKEAEQQLQQAVKMEAVGQLTGGVAHDFNNLLTVILGNLQLLERRVEGDERLSKRVRAASGAALRGADLTKRLLAFSRRQVLEPKTADLNNLVAGMDDLLRRTLGETIEIKVAQEADLWLVRVDLNQIENALLNLAINARDAMPQGGKLTIETANARLDEAYAARHTYVPAGPYVMLAVSDTGSGMPPEVIERAFEPFFTTKEVGKGTGLGLSMVYGFVKQSGGHINIYSEEGHGTTVKLYLPRAKAGDGPVVEEVAFVAAARAGGETILLVEDDAAVRDTAVALLEEQGYRVLEAEDGSAALGILGKHPDIDLLLTDVVMPGGMSGPELAREARTRRPDLKVLYTSGYTENAIVHRGALDEGVELIGKPYQKGDLARKVRRVLDS